MKVSRRNLLRTFALGAMGLWVPRSVAAPLGGFGIPSLGRNGSSSLLNGLTAYWQLGDAAGGTRLDMGPNALDLTDKNANEDRVITTINGATRAVLQTETTHVNDCLFHAANNLFKAGAGVSFTFAGWFAGGIILDHHTLANWDNGANNAYLLFTSSTEGQQVQWYTIELGTGTAHHLNIATVASMQSAGQSAWHHFAFGYDDTNKVMWCQDNNGVKQTAAVNGVIASNAQFTIGNLSSMTASQGVQISELGFWRRTLTAGEVTTLYNAGVPITYPFS